MLDLDLLELNARSSSHVDLLGLLAKEGWKKVRLGDYYSQKSRP